MRLPEYLGFNTAKARNQAHIDIFETISHCESLDDLEALEGEVSELIIRLKAEIKEGIDHRDYDYIEELENHYKHYHYLLKQKEDFTCY